MGQAAIPVDVEKLIEAADLLEVAGGGEELTGKRREAAIALSRFFDDEVRKLTTGAEE